MAAEDWDLARVISPLALDDFLANYWEKKPLLVRRADRDYYTALLSVADVDNIVTTRDLRVPALKLVKKGSSIPTGNYTSNVPWGGDVFTNVVNVERVFAEYQAGATIVLQALHRSWLPLSSFARDLEKQFNYPVQTNIYLTPPSAQGFAAHYDTHDVFVLQTGGQKHWLVYNAPVPLPDKHKPFNKNSTPTPELLFEVDLLAGDLLYLPRGFMHEALTSDSLSLHITAGVVVYTLGDLLADALAQLQESDPRFRQSLPYGLLNRENAAAEVRAEFDGLLQALGENTDLEQLLNRVASRFLTTRRPLVENRLLDITDQGNLTASTPLRHRRGLIAKVDRDGASAVLRYEGKRISMPDYVEPTLRYVLDHKKLTAAELPGLDEAGKLTLARRLVKEGFLVIDRGE